MSSFRAGLRNLIREIGRGLGSDQSLQRHSPPRAVERFMQNLSEEQRSQYERRGYFYVFGGDTGRLYRIRRGSMMNVELLDKNGKHVCMLCFGPKGIFPSVT
jgi:hypothetical protein